MIYKIFWGVLLPSCRFVFGNHGKDFLIHPGLSCLEVLSMKNFNSSGGLGMTPTVSVPLLDSLSLFQLKSSPSWAFGKMCVSQLIRRKESQFMHSGSGKGLWASQPPSLGLPVSERDQGLHLPVTLHFGALSAYHSTCSARESALTLWSNIVV